MRAHAILGADVTMENPDTSFIWQLGLFDWGTYNDCRFSPCMLNDDIAKPTRIRAWGIRLPSMQPICAWYPSKQRFSRGRTKEHPHVLLSTNKPGGKRMSTWKAATYQPGTVAAWSDDFTDRSREILVRAPAQEIPSQAQPVLTEIEEVSDSLFGDSGEKGTTLAITDRGKCHSARTSRGR